MSKYKIWTRDEETKLTVDYGHAFSKSGVVNPSRRYLVNQILTKYPTISYDKLYSKVTRMIGQKILLPTLSVESNKHKNWKHSDDLTVTYTRFCYPNMTDRDVAAFIYATCDLKRSIKSITLRIGHLLDKHIHRQAVIDSDIPQEYYYADHLKLVKSAYYNIIRKTEEAAAASLGSTRLISVERKAHEPVTVPSFTNKKTEEELDREVFSLQHTPITSPTKKAWTQIKDNFYLRLIKWASRRLSAPGIDMLKRYCREL